MTDTELVTHRLIADLALDALARVRGDGQVLGHRDWDRPAHLGAEVSLVRLTSSDSA